MTTIASSKSDQDMSNGLLYKCRKNIPENARRVKRFPERSKLILNMNLAIRSGSPRGQMVCLLRLAGAGRGGQGSSFLPRWFQLQIRLGLVRGEPLTLTLSSTE